MAWNSGYPPPPRRSRSRSPGRAPYPSYEDTYRDSLRDWDPYGRDRNGYGSWERDRAQYEYRRGRSRSPGPEMSRKRPRSGSPYDRDRYDPRPRYDDYDGHRPSGYSPPRRAPHRRVPPDPHTFDYPASLKQFADWFRYNHPQMAAEEDNADKAAEQEAGDGSKPRNGIKTRWENYKKSFAANQLQILFDHHRKSPWFNEKYDPTEEFQTLRKRVRKEGWKDRTSNFLLDLDAGKFDPEFTEPEPELPAKVNGGESAPDATNGDSGIGDSTEEPRNVGEEDDIQFNMTVEEEPTDADATRGDVNGKSSYNDRRADRGDEVSVMPEGVQVMIRTIPPDIGRVKLEDACCKVPGFVHLALGDPLQKRNYYRAGWIRFKDDVDITSAINDLTEKKIEGFKLHVSHILKPFTNRVRYAPEVASRPERLEKDLTNARTLAQKLEREASELRAWKRPVKDDEDAPMEAEDEEEPRERGCDAVEARIEKVMSELAQQGLVDPSDQAAYESKKTVVSLDLYLALLRAAFNTCYYCAVVTDHLEELQRKCIKHERKPLSKLMMDDIKTEGGVRSKDKTDETMDEDDKDGVKSAPKDKDWKRTDERWIEWLDSKVAVLINPEAVDPRNYGGKNFDDELSKAVKEYVSQEDEGKYRCKTCQKLFKATSFVEKHVANKHPELIKTLDDIPFFNNFVLDPHRIQPFSHPPPVSAMGPNQLVPPQAYGLQGTGPEFRDYRDQQQYGKMHPHANNGHHHNHRRDEGPNNRRLTDRLGGFAELPAKPAGLDQALSSGNGNTQARRNTRGPSSGTAGPPPPPPPDAKEDPRAAAGRRVSYHDMDLVAEGDVELSY
ncbi:unnamed protein product [Mycena citricolor]|uniref:C2H2-type domain-containing protein n=1 Tax=Mycena citricolor TaxID=2018698 RepID=A0AAD2GU27_9AGAR|nr:unnamed protein product [Mycena citricolor]CAK5276109.1 unnamed protein product [Mycena citricolor]